VTEIAILGAGMAGFGAASRLREAGLGSSVYEKSSFYGGHAASFRHGDFVFDDGPHISFTQNERLQKFFAESVNDEYEVIQNRVNNYWKGHWIKHPAQCNLYGLPAELNVAILRDFIAAQGEAVDQVSQIDQQDRSGPIAPFENYAEWLVATFGRTFAETFPMEYGRKYHTTPAENMTTDWLGPRLYRPQLEEVLRGALSPTTPDVHYVSHFRYPRINGFGSYLDRSAQESQLKLSHRLTSLDPQNLELEFANGLRCNPDHLISSLPLPSLIDLCTGVPSDVVEAAGKLAASTCVIINIGINRADISEAHWSYFYDAEIFFTRVSFPHMFSPHNVPDGAGSIQVEVYYSQKYRPLDRDPEDCIEPVLADLRRCGLVREDDQILYTGAAVVPFANIIFDHERAPALEVVQGYLDEVGIHSCGRYGEWGYHWTDESFESGEGAGQKVIDRL
jgi:protoporphyrinogen oxidase